MPKPDHTRLWQRVRDSQPTAVLGRLPDPPQELQLLRVSCEVAPAALRPLLEARRLTEAVLGDTRKPEKAKLVRRRTLFGDTPERATEARGGRAVEPAGQAKGGALGRGVRRGGAGRRRRRWPR